MTSTLQYCDEYPVEPFDHVELHKDGAVFRGQITRIFPRKGEVRVRFADHANCRRDGEPVMRSAIALVQQVDLIGRDG
ncbi:hypothetical protein DDZ14_16215 [Maritimibacter sp. 55A14]|uniref:hypothetical protein n=1 Tax=Maritimibacter sp. 55A14 TaxID=2174844 RepID=UPI000D60BCB3|nr:hypothetical protein [Maritimibacter sp. 55A14]PWE29984.1 hypothetical protein DDZ14_16215 [Maritimibacter sp. 55A14]